MHFSDPRSVHQNLDLIMVRIAENSSDDVTETTAILILDAINGHLDMWRRSLSMPQIPYAINDIELKRIESTVRAIERHTLYRAPEMTAKASLISLRDVLQSISGFTPEDIQANRNWFLQTFLEDPNEMIAAYRSNEEVNEKLLSSKIRTGGCSNLPDTGTQSGMTMKKFLDGIERTSTVLGKPAGSSSRSSWTCKNCFFNNAAFITPCSSKTCEAEREIQDPPSSKIQTG